MSKASRERNKKIVFTKWANIKYRKKLNLSETAVLFYSWDDYAMFLWLKLCKKNDEKYYELLEEDFKEFSDCQQENKQEKNEGIKTR